MGTESLGDPLALLGIKIEFERESCSARATRRLDLSKQPDNGDEDLGFDGEHAGEASGGIGGSACEGGSGGGLHEGGRRGFGDLGG